MITPGHRVCVHDRGGGGWGGVGVGVTMTNRAGEGVRP